MSSNALRRVLLCTPYCPASFFLLPVRRVSSVIDPAHKSLLILSIVASFFSGGRPAAPLTGTAGPSGLSKLLTRIAFVLALATPILQSAASPCSGQRPMTSSRRNQMSVLYQSDSSRHRAPGLIGYSPSSPHNSAGAGGCSLNI
jgi:hypothetical protein